MMIVLRDEQVNSVVLTKTKATTDDFSNYQLALTCRATNNSERSTLTSVTDDTRVYRFTIRVNMLGHGNYIELQKPQEVGGFYDFVFSGIRRSDGVGVTLETGLAYFALKTDADTFEGYESSTTFKAYQ